MLFRSSLQAATEDEHSNNQGPQSPFAGPSLGSPVKGHSDVAAASDRFKKLRNILSFEMERRMTLESKPSPERFMGAWSVPPLPSPLPCLSITPRHPHASGRLTTLSLCVCLCVCEQLREAVGGPGARTRARGGGGPGPGCHRCQ